jgi:hypothetical protein
MVHTTKTNRKRAKLSPGKSPGKKTLAKTRGNWMPEQVVMDFFWWLGKAWGTGKLGKDDGAVEFPFRTVTIEFGGVAYTFPYDVACDAGAVPSAYFKDGDGLNIYDDEGEAIKRHRPDVPIAVDNYNRINRLFSELEDWERACSQLGLPTIDVTKTARMIVGP